MPCYRVCTKAILVSKAALVYAGCSLTKAPLVLCWLVPHDLVAYICVGSNKFEGLSGDRLLAESKVTGLAVGDRMYKVPTIKVSDT